MTASTIGTIPRAGAIVRTLHRNDNGAYSVVAAIARASGSPSEARLAAQGGGPAQDRLDRIQATLEAGAGFRPERLIRVQMTAPRHQPAHDLAVALAVLAAGRGASQVISRRQTLVCGALTPSGAVAGLSHVSEAAAAAQAGGYGFMSPAATVDELVLELVVPQLPLVAVSTVEEAFRILTEVDM